MGTTVHTVSRTVAVPCHFVTLKVFNSLLSYTLLRFPIGDDDIIYIEKDKYTAFDEII